MPTELLSAKAYYQLLREKLSRGEGVFTAFKPSEEAIEVMEALREFDVNRARRLKKGGLLYGAWMALSHLARPIESYGELLERLDANLYGDVRDSLLSLYLEAMVNGNPVKGLLPIHKVLAHSYLIPMGLYSLISNDPRLDETLLPAFSGPGGEELAFSYEEMVKKVYIYTPAALDVALEATYLESAYRLWNNTYGLRKREVVRGVAGREEGAEMAIPKLERVLETLMAGSPAQLGKAIRQSLCFFLSYLGSLLKEGQRAFCP